MILNSYNDIHKHFKLNPLNKSLNNSGFSGDFKLIQFMDKLLKKSDNFIETGTCMGNTLYFVSRNYNIKSYSCEIGNWEGPEIPYEGCKYKTTPQSIVNHKNVYFEQVDSISFLKNIVDKNPNIINEKCVFFLDAHSPVRGGDIHLEELKYILSTFKDYYILVDDVNIKVAGFKFDEKLINKDGRIDGCVPAGSEYEHGECELFSHNSYSLTQITRNAACHKFYIHNYSEIEDYPTGRISGLVLISKIDVDEINVQKLK